MSKNGIHGGSDRNTTSQIIDSHPNEFLREQVRELTSSARTMARPLSQIANKQERAAKKFGFARARLTYLENQDDRLRQISVCAVCGGKALYWMMGKRYCKSHIAIGKAAHAKKWTPQAKGKKA